MAGVAGAADHRGAAIVTPALFFELAVDQRPQPRRGTQRFAVVVKRQIFTCSGFTHPGAGRSTITVTGCRRASRNARRQPQARRVLKSFQHGLKGS